MKLALQDWLVLLFGKQRARLYFADPQLTALQNYNQFWSPGAKQLNNSADKCHRQPVRYIVYDPRWLSCDLTGTAGRNSCGILHQMKSWDDSPETLSFTLKAKSRYTVRDSKSQPVPFLYSAARGGVEKWASTRDLQASRHKVICIQNKSVNGIDIIIKDLLVCRRTLPGLDFI